MDTKLRISFDFDCTLSEHFIQLIAKALIAAGHEIWIVTARCDDRLHDNELTKATSINRDLFKIAERLNIPDERIMMTEGSFKYKTLAKHNIFLHFDDVPEEVELIVRNGGNALLIWDTTCSASIKHDSFGKGIF